MCGASGWADLPGVYCLAGDVPLVAVQPGREGASVTAERAHDGSLALFRRALWLFDDGLLLGDAAWGGADPEAREAVRQGRDPVREAAAAAWDDGPGHGRREEDREPAAEVEEPSVPEMAVIAAAERPPEPPASPPPSPPPAPLRGGPVPPLDGDGTGHLFEIFGQQSLDLFFVYHFVCHGEDTEGPDPSVPIPAVRLAHLRTLFDRANQGYGFARFAPHFSEACRRLLQESGAADLLRDADLGVEGAQLALSRRLWPLSPRRWLRLFRSLEADTRGQATNVVWHAVRLETITATRFHETLASGRVARGSEPTGERGRSAAMRFGSRCEPLVRALLVRFALRSPEEEQEDGRRSEDRGGRGAEGGDDEPAAGVAEAAPERRDSGSSVVSAESSDSDATDDGFGAERRRRRRVLRLRLALEPLERRGHDRPPPSPPPPAAGRHDEGEDLGLLIAPDCGVLGASFDLVVGVSRDDDGLLIVGPAAAVYEIKCRYKYLRDRDDPPTAALVARPGLDTLAAFLLSHPICGVEYRRRGEVPTGREALVSYDEVFRRRAPSGGLKRPRGGIAPDYLAPWLDELLRLNAGVTSTVYVFDVRPTEEEADGIAWLDLDAKAVFSAPVFVNPRHPYYCQMMLQHYVLSQYYINARRDPERSSPDELPVVRLTSAFFRRRADGEKGRPLRVRGRPLDEAAAAAAAAGGVDAVPVPAPGDVDDHDVIPLCLIVTPVLFDAGYVGEAVRRVLRAWERRTERIAGISPWVPDAVNAYVATARPKPGTP